jgi:hypothetical protein
MRPRVAKSFVCATYPSGYAHSTEPIVFTLAAGDATLSPCDTSRTLSRRRWRRTRGWSGRRRWSGPRRWSGGARILHNEGDILRQIRLGLRLGRRGRGIPVDAHVAAARM